MATQTVRIVIIPLVLLCGMFAAPELYSRNVVTFTIVGRIAFTVPGDWKVIDSRSNASRTIFAFQIPNSADQGTPDSTNLAVIAFNLSDRRAAQTYARMAADREPGEKISNVVNGWNCSTFFAKQGSTTYSAWDCSRALDRNGIYVRLAWPELPKNPARYGETMRAELADLLKSVAPYSVGQPLPPSRREK